MGLPKKPESLILHFDEAMLVKHVKIQQNEKWLKSETLS